MYTYRLRVSCGSKVCKRLNGCHIGFAIEQDREVILVSAIDNLIKGAGGQAIQNMNIMFDLDEDLGLPQIGWSMTFSMD